METIIEIGKWAELFRTSQSFEIRRSIEALDGASKFLKNQFKELLKVKG